MTYTHLTQDERYQIHALKQKNISLTSIAAELGRDRSTISRELKRNGGPTDYKPARAHKQARTRQCDRRNACHFSPEQWSHVNAYLRLHLSPQQCSGRLKVEKAISISTESIYQHAYRDKAQGGDLVSYLRCQKVRRKRYASGQERRGVLKNRIGIEQRPAVVDQRSRIGDWEGDTVIGQGHQGVLVTLVERKSRYTLAARLDSRHSAKVTPAIIALLRPHKDRCKTLTFDNGKEFAEHEFIAKCLQAKVYFAHPYCSWERGLNENHNGLLRQFFPKNTNLLKVSEDEVNDAVYRLNHRPRKCLGYRTPHEVFYRLKMTPLKLPTDALCSLICVCFRPLPHVLCAFIAKKYIAFFFTELRSERLIYCVVSSERTAGLTGCLAAFAVRHQRQVSGSPIQNFSSNHIRRRLRYFDL